MRRTDPTQPTILPCPKHLPALNNTCAHTQELRDLLVDDAKAEGVQFVDVREPGEHDAASLPRFKLFPLSQAAKCVSCMRAARWRV